MPRSQLTHFAISFGLLCAAVSAWPQSVPSVGEQQIPVVRATTRMVVVNVVVHDKKGAPVGGLTQNDFTVLDGGRKQQISIFSVESGRPAHRPLEPLPPNEFSNRVNREGGVPTSVAVILLDVLNTRFEDRAWARRQLIKFLTQLQPRDRVALYVLGRQLRVVQDFTSDPAPLLEALRHGAGSPGAIPGASGLNDASASGIAGLSGPAADAATRLGSSLADQINAEPHLRQGLMTSAALEAIANHLWGLPGRKSLIWVTGSIPLLHVFSPSLLPREDPQLAASCARMVHALNESDVAIYPIDARGLFVDPDFKAENAGRSHFESGEAGRALALMNLEISYMKYYAQQTGGRAFHNTNDLRVSLRSALDDSELTYTLGYYPSGVTWDGRYRPIKVVVDRRGIQVRHRQGYIATAGAPPEKTDPQVILRDAAASPLDATALGLTATVEPSKNSAESKFQVSVLIDPRGVTSPPANGVRRVLLDVLAGQYSNQGNPLGGVTKTISADLKEPDYEKIVRAGGFNLTFDYNVKPGGGELRVVVRDLLSGSIGSLHIPLDHLGPNP